MGPRSGQEGRVLSRVWGLGISYVFTRCPRLETRNIPARSTALGWEGGRTHLIEVTYKAHPECSDLLCAVKYQYRSHVASQILVGWKITQMSINEWTNKTWYIQIMEYYLAIKMDGVLVSCYNMDMPWKYYAKLKKTQTQKNTYDSIYEKCPE